MNRPLIIGAFLMTSLSIVFPSWGYEPTVPSVPVDTKELPHTTEESDTFWDYLKQRTHLGFGFDEAYTDNLLLTSRNAKEEYVTALESEIFFADPRGSLLYGVDYNVKGSLYHRLNLEGVEHRLRAFTDLQPGGRIQYRLDYLLRVDNNLLFGPDNVDILRASNRLIPQITHEGIGKIRYALNDTNALVPKVDYLVFDDQENNDADTDRREFKGILDLDHDLIPAWTVFTGYEFDNVNIVGHQIKNSQSHGARAGVRYELTEISKLELLVKYDLRDFDSGQHRNSLGFAGTWEYQAGPLAKLSLSYKDERIPSYSSTTLQFRNVGPTLDTSYELTPLIKLTSWTSYQKHRSDTQDILLGSGGSPNNFSQYNLSGGIHWRPRDKTHVDLDYIYTRSVTSDYKSHTVRFGFDFEF